MKVLKWAGIVLGVLVAFAAVAAGYIWIAAGNILERTYALPDTTFVANPATANLAEGERLGRVRGCVDGCHGDGLGGNVFNDDFIFGRIVAPDLTRSFAEMSDAEIDLAVRHGIRRDGRSMTVMPSASFYHLSDRELNDLAAYIRSHTPGNGPELEVKPGPVARFFIWNGMFTPQAETVQAEAPWIDAADRQSEHATGRYLALTVCGECHGLDLAGTEGFTPGLAVAIAYSREDFGRLMREGKPIGDRELNLMREVAVSRFSHFTDEEIDALYGYLKTLTSGST